MNRSAGREAGYAAAAAMLVAAAFALTAAQVARSSRSAVVGAEAQSVHARLSADADAGVALALASLTSDDVNGRWEITDQPHALSFDDAALTVRVEDERAKIPLNTLTPAQILTLFTAAGADVARARTLQQAFLDWRDPQRADRDKSRPIINNAGGFQTIYDLNRVDGMDGPLWRTLEPVVTTVGGDTPFDPKNASTLALAVMTGQGEGSVKAIEREREQAGQRTALDVSHEPQAQPHALTLRVEARDAQGDRASAAYLVELTGSKSHRYVIRQRLPS